MRNLYTTLLLSGLPFLAAAQPGLTNVTIQPTNPNACQLVGITVNGTLPNNGQPQGFVPSFSADNDTLYVRFNASGSGGGNAGFSQQIPGIAQFDAGQHWIVVTLFINNNEVDEVTVTFNVSPPFNPDAGLFNDTLLCNSGPPFPLIGVLDGDPDPGGTWVNPNGQVVNNGLFDPGQSPEGFYTYQFDLLPPCIPASQQVLFSYFPNNSPGLNGSVPVCATGGPAVELISELGGTPYTPGTWTKPGGGSHSGTFVPGVDACGVYTYTVPGVGSCPAPTATVNVQCVQPPNAGVGGSIALCFNDSAENLSLVVTGEQSGGVWIDQGGFTVGQYNGNVNCAFNGAQTYGYLVTAPPCPNDTSFVVVTLVGPPCTIGMAEDATVQRFDLMPNPAQDEVVLELEVNAAGGERAWELVDVNGRVLRSERLQMNGTYLRRTIPVQDLPRGVYMVRLLSAEGSMVKRLMVH